ncbi:GDSL esterase/lipase At5g08460 [Linum perenne]
MPPPPPPRHLTAAIFIILGAAATCFPPPSADAVKAKTKNNHHHHSKHVFEPKSTAMVNGMFVFGSSLVDNGNNQFLPGDRSAANYTPYGIDFPSGPTGRYTNGKNVVDLLCDKLGLPLLPASRNPATAAEGGKGIFYGVDFASGGSGILNNTGGINHLHGLGARKFVLMSLNPLGCYPIALVRDPKTGKFTCAKPMNQAAQLFNEKQKSMVDRLNQQLPRSKLVIVNAYDIINKILSNPRLAG